MLISPAYAQAGGGGDLVMSLAPLVLIFAVFYFLLIRPQQKKMKEHREMLANIRRNDRIVTNGGLVGIVTKVSDTDDLLTLEIASGIKVQVVRGMIAELRAKGQPVSNRSSKAKSKPEPEPEPEDDDRDEAEETAKDADKESGKAAG
jgi:preprotein translocase subunit YajC